ncbi:hypothetical protein HY988_01050 [Candidatus Micrarchaeota archaeon]|nr:hypothetical protein [Candidatus Micrarchaeota archaeon]
MNLAQGVSEYVTDSRVRRLIAINQLLRECGGNGITSALKEMRNRVRTELIEHYRILFAARKQMEVQNPTPHGQFRYSAREQEQLPLPAPFRTIALPRVERAAIRSIGSG